MAKQHKHNLCELQVRNKHRVSPKLSHYPRKRCSHCQLDTHPCLQCLTLILTLGQRRHVPKKSQGAHLQHPTGILPPDHCHHVANHTPHTETSTGMNLRHHIAGHTLHPETLAGKNPEYHENHIPIRGVHACVPT